MARNKYQSYPSNTMPLDPRPNQWDWQQRGLCREVDSEVFFYEDQERGDNKADRIAKARAICNACPVTKECFDFSIRTSQSHGMWGGLTEDERREYIRGRQGSTPSS